VSVSLHHRDAQDRAGGLGSAVLAGLRRTASRWAVVMDGDLQHPPELVPQLIAVGERDDADVVVASRHVPGGSSAGLSSISRVLVSDLSITLSKVVFPKQLRGISDPMSGFFALKPASFDLAHLRPNGFKILLELVARSPEVGKAEMPFVFGERLAGESKASLREGFIFMLQLVRLRLARMISVAGRSRVLHRGAGFAAVGITGMFVNIAVMWALADPAALGVNYLFAAALATQASSSWNFLLIDRLVYRGPKRLTATKRWLGFMTMSNAVLILRIPMLWLLVSALHLHYLPATAATLLLGFALRFKSQERLTLMEEIA
jgi:dolichol-phosphate mannosyltransferase